MGALKDCVREGGRGQQERGGGCGEKLGAAAAGKYQHSFNNTLPPRLARLHIGDAA